MFGFNKNYMWQYPGINLQNKNKTFSNFTRISIKFSEIFFLSFFLLLSTFTFLISLIWNLCLEKDTIYNYQKIQRKPPLNEMKEITTNSFKKSHDQSLTVTKPKKYIM